MTEKRKINIKNFKSQSEYISYIINNKKRRREGRKLRPEVDESIPYSGNFRVNLHDEFTVIDEEKDGWAVYKIWYFYIRLFPRPLLWTRHIKGDVTQSPRWWSNWFCIMFVTFLIYGICPTPIIYYMSWWACLDTGWFLPFTLLGLGQLYVKFFSNIEELCNDWKYFYDKYFQYYWQQARSEVSALEKFNVYEQMSEHYNYDVVQNMIWAEDRNITFFTDDENPLVDNYWTDLEIWFEMIQYGGWMSEDDLLELDVFYFSEDNMVDEDDQNDFKYIEEAKKNSLMNAEFCFENYGLESVDVSDSIFSSSCTEEEEYFVESEEAEMYDMSTNYLDIEAFAKKKKLDNKK